MKNIKLFIGLFVVNCCWVSSAIAFDSGSTGADGDFAPASDITLGLPDSGIFNFTTVNIPEGVTVRR